MSHCINRHGLLKTGQNSTHISGISGGIRGTSGGISGCQISVEAPNWLELTRHMRHSIQRDRRQDATKRREERGPRISITFRHIATYHHGTNYRDLERQTDETDRLRRQKDRRRQTGENKRKILRRMSIRTWVCLVWLSVSSVCLSVWLSFQVA